jgi:tight adherence protein B
VIGVALMTVLVFALVGQAAWLVTDSFRGQESSLDPIAKRVATYTELSWQSRPPDATSILRRTRFSRLPWLDNLLERFNLAQSLSRDLRCAGVPVRAGEFLFAQLAATTLAGFIALLVFPNIYGGVLPAAGAGLLAFAVPLVWLRFQRGKRLSQFEADLPDALDMVCSSLRSGYGLQHGLDLIARENDGPVGQEFGQVLQEVALGAELEPALARVTERIDSEDLQLLVTAIGVQRRTGGNLIDVLQQMTHTLRERQRLRAEVRVITTAPRVSGYVVSCVPVGIACYMYVLSRYSFDLLLNEPIGRVALIGSAFLVLLGLLLNRRISNVDY